MKKLGRPRVRQPVPSRQEDQHGRVPQPRRPQVSPRRLVEERDHVFVVLVTSRTRGGFLMGGAHGGAGGHARVAEQAEATGRVGNFVRQSGKRERRNDFQSTRAPLLPSVAKDNCPRNLDRLITGKTLRARTREGNEAPLMPLAQGPIRLSRHSSRYGAEARGGRYYLKAHA